MNKYRLLDLLKLALVVFVSSFILTACGGGGGDEPVITPANVAGYWTIRNTSEPNMQDDYIQVYQDGATLSGSFLCEKNEEVSGVISGNSIKIEYVMESSNNILNSLNGSINNDSILGTYQTTNGYSGNWTGIKNLNIPCSDTYAPVVISHQINNEMTVLTIEFNERMSSSYSIYGAGGASNSTWVTDRVLRISTTMPWSSGDKITLGKDVFSDLDGNHIDTDYIIIL